MFFSLYDVDTDMVALRRLIDLISEKDSLDSF